VGKIIAIFNQNEGVQKNTAALVFFWSFRALEKRALLNDVNLRLNAIKKSLAHKKAALLDQSSAPMELTDLELELINKKVLEFVLKHSTAELGIKYDVNLIYYSPSIYILALNMIRPFKTNKVLSKPTNTITNECNNLDLSTLNYKSLIGLSKLEIKEKLGLFYNDINTNRWMYRLRNRFKITKKNYLYFYFSNDHLRHYTLKRFKIKSKGFDLKKILIKTPINIFFLIDYEMYFCN